MQETKKRAEALFSRLCTLIFCIHHAAQILDIGAPWKPATLHVGPVETGGPGTNRELYDHFVATTSAPNRKYASKQYLLIAIAISISRDWWCDENPASSTDTT